MKRFFLIPLLTLMCSVMAWGAEVATLAELQAAVPTTTGSAEITLTEDISTDATALTVPEGVTVTLNLNNHSITVEKTLAEFSQDLNSGLDAIVVNKGGTLTVYGDGAITCHFTCTEFDYFDTGRAITSNGTLTLIGDVDITGGITGVLNAATSTVNIGTDFTGTVTGAFALPSSCVSGGYWTSNPQTYLVSGYGTEEVDGLFHVIESDVVYVAMIDNQGYETLQAAVDAASDGDVIELLADATAVTVGKEVTFVTVNMSTFDSYDASAITAAEGYTIAEDPTGWGINVYDAKEYALYDFLTKEGTDSYTVSSNVDIAEWPFGAVSVVGTKTLTIAEGVTVTYKRQSGANIVIPVGATLTVLGSGTFEPVITMPSADLCGLTVETGSQQTGNRAIDVYGTLNVGVKDDANNCPHFITSSLSKGSAIMVMEGGTATIDNIDVLAAAYALVNEGTAYINGGYFKSVSTTNNGYNSGWHTYCIDNRAKMILKNTTVVGQHGGVACQKGTGTLSIDNCNLQALDMGKGGVHYALYVCTKSVVSAYDTKFYSENGSNTIVIGDNDSQNSFGLIYLYGGCKTDRKLYVQKKRGQDDDILFPVLVSEQSEWYKRALIGGQDTEGKLLPANTVYSPIDEQVYDINGDPIEGKKYLFCVVSTAETAEVDENATTIPWQQSSTWDATKASTDTEEVPTNATVVTIPAGKTVVVSADEDKNNGITKAVAEQIFIGDGAKLTVEAGTTLTVGDGGVNIANGGQMIVKDGAVVRVGKSGLVTTEEEALVIENTQTKAGVFMIDPAVTENTQPKATVKLESKAYHDETNDIFHWQHFAIPTVGVPDEFKMPVATAIYDLDENNAWKTLSGMSELGTPFKGYNLTNWATAKGTVYEFYGNIIGNGDGKANFTGRGYNFCGNSYTAPIDIMRMLQDIKNNTTVDVEPTITIYDTENDKYQAVTVTSIENTSWMGTAVFTQIAPMQGFFLNLRTNEAGEYEVIDYSNSVWGNPSIATGGMLAPARHEANDNKGIRMVVAANGREDDVLMVEKAEYTATFDDGADATKKMSERSFNLYANINNEKQAVVATNNMENMLLGFESVEAGEYTIRFYANNVEGEYYLLDVLTGAKMAIANGAEYTFTQDANVANAVRFEIIGAAKVPTALENVAETATKKGIYTMSGQFVGNDYNALPAGVYVLDGQKIVK